MSGWCAPPRVHTGAPHCRYALSVAACCGLQSTVLKGGVRPLVSPERAGNGFPPPGRGQVDVVTVDDQAVFRSAARDVIDATPGFNAVGEAASGEEALALLERIDPALVLVDVRMPGMGGLEAARRIKALRPGTVVVLISLEEPEDIPSTASACGAATFVRKQEFRPSTLRGLWLLHGPG
jgi:two-component system invasion response regulator UvrY